MEYSQIIFIGTMLLSWIMVIVGSGFVPYYSRKDVAFGIAIPESVFDSAFFATLRKRYLIIHLVVGGLCAIGSSLYLYVNPTEVATFYVIGLLLAYTLFSGIFYIIYYYKVKTYKQSQHWVIDSKVKAPLVQEVIKGRVVQPFWFSSYFIIILGNIILLLYQYPHLPDQIPMHYNIAGEVDRWVSKSYGAFFPLIIIEFMMALLFIGIYFGVTKAKKQPTNNSFQNDLRFKTITNQMMFFMGLLILLLFTSIVVGMLFMLSPTYMMVMPIIFIVLIMMMTGYLVFKVGQGGSRLPSSSPHSTTSSSDEYWKWGSFYINKQDPSIFVEKRFGLGFTLNFGNPISILIMIGLFLFIIILTIVPFLFT